MPRPRPVQRRFAPPEPRANPTARAAVERPRAAVFDPDSRTLHGHGAVRAIAESSVRAGGPDPARVASAHAAARPCRPCSVPSPSTPRAT